MVARTTSQAGGAAALFRMWRMAIGRTLSVARAGSERIRVSSAPQRLGRAAVGYLRSPGPTIAAADPEARTALTALGATAALAGALAAAIVAQRSGATAASAALAALSPMGWAVARLALFEALGRDREAGQRPRFRTAWAAALLPFGLAWTPALRALAFLTSAALTYAGLLGAGVDVRRTRVLCALGFGVEALAAVTSWIVGNGLLFVPALGN